MTQVLEVRHHTLPLENLACRDGTAPQRARRLLREGPLSHETRAELRQLWRALWTMNKAPHPLRQEFMEAPMIDAARPGGSLRHGGPPALSVLLPVRGAHDCLRLALECLSAHTWAGHEVVVTCAQEEAAAVADVVRHVIVTTPPRVLGTERVVIVATDEPQGFPANVNVASLYAAAPVLAILNSDAYVGNGWDVELRTALERPGTVGAGPIGQVLCPNLDVEGGCDSVEQVTEMSMRAWQGLGRPHGAVTGRLVGFCFMVRTEHFERVGGLSEVYGLGNFDDDDLSLKLRFLGELRTAPMLVCHGGSQSFKQLPGGAALYEELLVENGKVFHDRWDWIADTLPQVPMETVIVEGAS